MLPTLLAAALVWLPPETFTRWSEVDALLRARPQIRLTVALTPQMATPLAKAALSPWAAQGRLEIAGRVHGDPVLPLVAAHPAAPRPDDALERSAEARQSVERRMGVPVAGFVPGGGALEPSLVGPLAASGASWALVGPYDAAGWARSGSMTYVPGRAAQEDLTAPGVFVVDESSQADSSFLAALSALGRARPKDGWTTVSGLVAQAGASGPDAASIASWPGWDGAAAGPPADPAARDAWDAYGEAAKALARYQNSGAADMQVLEAATLLLRKAQAARFFRAPEPGAPDALPKEMRISLLAMYRRIKATPPDSFYAAAPGAAASSTADQPTSVHAASGPGWISFDNPAGTIARAPAGASTDSWRLKGLRVEWDDDHVLLRVFPARVDSSTGPHPVYDVYVDLNHVVGAGSIRLLDGRGAFAQARDAWEFALEIAGNEARLWRAGTEETPDQVARLPVERDAAKGEVRVSIPRAQLRGNPAHWGYIVMALAEDPARAGRSPAVVLVGPDGSQTLGLIAPLDQQKAVLEHPGTPQRVTAVRLDSGPNP